MKRGLDHEEQVSKKVKIEIPWTCPGSRHEKEEALASFARLKAAKSTCSPSYVNVLPTPILDKIMDQLMIEDAITCFRTCRQWRTTALALLHWKDILHISPTLPTAVAKGSQGKINTLAVELLIEILSHLDIDELLSCQIICKRWRQVIQNGSSKFLRKVELYGDLEKIDRQWERVLQLSKGHSPISLSLNRSRYIWRDRYDWDEEDDWADQDLIKEFPHDTLQELHYKAQYSSHVDQELWNTLLKCTQLKVLTFDAGILEDIYCDFEIDINSKLAKCRLESFTLSYHLHSDPLYLDKGMCALLSEARSITLDSTYSSSEALQEVVRSAKDTLEELNILRNDTDELPFAHVSSEGNETTANDADEEDMITLSNLVSFKGYLPGKLCVKAPQLKKLELKAEKTDDFVLVMSCSQILEEFDCFLDRTESYNQFGFILDSLLTSLTKLTSCHTLSLDLGQFDGASTSKDKQLEFDDIQAFWNDYLFDDIDLLPSLRSLTISNLHGKYPHCPISFEELFYWLELRKEDGQPLESLTIVGFDQFSVLSLRQLREVVPLITYRCGSKMDGQSLTEEESEEME